MLERAMSGRFSPLPLRSRSATFRFALRSRSIVFCHARSTLRSAAPDFRPALFCFPLRSHALKPRPHFSLLHSVKIREGKAKCLRGNFNGTKDTASGILLSRFSRLEVWQKNTAAHLQTTRPPTNVGCSVGLICMLSC